MNFYLTGIDYRSSPLDRRERIYRKRRAIAGFWAAHSSQQAAILITCNRFEIYGIAEDIAEAKRHIDIFSREFPEFAKDGYTKLGKEHVFRHALRLASGLKSQLKGEGEILEQLNAWCNQPGFPLELFRLWNEAIWDAQYIRLEARLNERKYNIATLVLEDIFEHVHHDKRIEIAIVGTGKVAELFASNSAPEARFSFIANKNYLKARQLAGRVRGEVFSFDDLPDIILKVDAIVSATASPHFILRKDGLSTIAAKRANALYLYDVAMPRDIDPKVGEIKNIILKNTEDLAGLFLKYNESIDHRINLAAYLVEEAVERHKGAFDEDVTGRNTTQLIGNKTG